MKPMSREWVSKAEGDFAIVERESRARKDPSYDGICFHAQQCAEKYLKARLCQADVPFAKTHDLTALLNQVLPLEPSWETYRADLAYLTDFSVSFRYPGESATAEMAREARRRCKSFRLAARTALGLRRAQEP